MAYKLWKRLKLAVFAGVIIIAAGGCQNTSVSQTGQTGTAAEKEAGQEEKEKDSDEADSRMDAGQQENADDRDGMTDSEDDNSGKTDDEDNNADVADDGDSDAGAIDYEALADELNSIITDDYMTEMDMDMLEATFDISKDILSGAKVYLSSGATANEIAVFCCKDEEAVKTVMDSLEQRVETRETSYKDYNPQEAEKLSNSIIGSKGNCVILVVAGDMDAAEDILEKY